MIRSEEGGQVRNLFFLAKAFQHRRLGRLLQRLGGRRQPGHAFSICNGTGRYAKRSDAHRAPFHRDRTHDLVDGRLRCIGVDLCGVGDCRLRGRDRDQAGAGLSQMRESGVIRVEDAACVNVHDGLEPFRLQVLRHRQKIPGGARDDHINLAEFFGRNLKCARHRLRIAHISRDGGAGGPVAFDYSFRCGQLVFVARQKDNVHAFLGVFFRNAQRNPAGAAGQKGCFPGKAIHFISPAFRPTTGVFL